jgi:hypothetical protein
MDKANIKKVKSLNERIESIQTKRTKAETQKEMLLSSLDAEIKKYSENYGVDLKGKSLKETISLILAEQSKVVADIKSEYELKEKVVSAIESGNIAEANKLLGITDEEEVVVDEEEVEEEYSSDDFDDIEDEETDYFVDEEEDDFGGVDDSDYSDDEEDEEDDFSFDELGTADEVDEKAVENLGTNADDIVEELDTADDDDIYGDMDMDDFGFGDILSGSKLDI